MSIIPFERLISNTSTVFLGIDMDQAAINAANGIGNHPDFVPRLPNWSSIEKFDNDSSSEDFSPFGGVQNPDYIWDQPTSDGQTSAFAIASKEFTIPSTLLTASFSIFLDAVADNAMKVKIELFEKIGGNFVKTAPQPSGLGDITWISGDPNNPAVGLTETKPFNWQDIRMYSTRFTVPSSKTLKIVVSFEATNYLIQPPGSFNAAGLQFVADIYATVPEFIYISNIGDNTIKIYDITNPVVPVLTAQFNGGVFNFPGGLAITDSILYIANSGNDTVEIFDITNPIAPVHVSQFNGGNLNQPFGLIVTDNILYVSSVNDSTVQIYDITNPTTPSHLGQFNGGNLNSPMDLAITGNTLYVANSGNNTVQIYDITNPIAPAHLGQFNGANLNSPVGLAIIDNILYVSNNTDNTVEIYDITNPTTPAHLGQFNGGNLNAPIGLAITDNILYVANNGDSTVEIYDITNSTAPVRIREFNGGNLNFPIGLVIFTLLD